MEPLTFPHDPNPYTAERHVRSGRWVVSHGRVTLFELGDAEVAEMADWLKSLNEKGF